MTASPSTGNPSEPTLRIGYLHLGDPRHGVCRYGRMIADAVSDIDGVLVTEVALDSDASTADLLEAAKKLSEADVIHTQYSRSLWGEGPAAPHRLRRFLNAAESPVVVSLHDVYPTDPWQAWKKRPKTLAKRFARWRRRRARQVPTVDAIRTILKGASKTLVCFEEERRRLTRFAGSDRIRVVGHFIEPVAVPERSSARAKLGLPEDEVVLTVLGFIHPRKGYDLMVDAFIELGPGYRCVFAGAPSPGNEAYMEKLQRRAKTAELQDRLTVTGFLSLEEQAIWMSATDLAVCPFRFLSASGSLATWIGAGRRMISHHTPQIDEYRSIANDAFATFQPFEASALTAAIRAEVKGERTGADPALAPLRERFGMTRIAKDHLDLYRETVA